ncbi:thiamine phosphate synthase [Autumnicola psychrophila]|uniref:Thiamine phosphate synthase n=1 Tax=Autumnicola psychrophila TaxID=3075592 RepID=A0ABU3DQF2_9FLAO|nr:thiamine phosphate synthase [Zunongwangia sp. F225]MDT0685945.1 thiamine phosphate synthase [Zunongwangia sp. F225]
MLILFTSEENMAAEREQLIHFFKNGLPLLHVRKPKMTEEELKLWLSDFEEKQLQKMVLHQHLHLAEVFPVKGIHLKESFRSKKEYLPEYVEQFQMKGFTVSSSFHEAENLKSEASLFDYVFLSPVFTSVSKKGYSGKAFNVGNLPFKVIALGGVEADKISKAKEMGYAGVAVLGAVWLAENKNQAFTEIYNEYKNVYQ